jgi:hypothetical protein
VALLQAKPEKTAVVGIRVPLSLKRLLDELRTVADQAGFDLSATLTEAIERAAKQIAGELEAIKPKAPANDTSERATRPHQSLTPTAPYRDRRAIFRPCRRQKRADFGVAGDGSFRGIRVTYPLAGYGNSAKSAELQSYNGNYNFPIIFRNIITQLNQGVRDGRKGDQNGLTPVGDPTSQRELGAGKGKMAAGAGGRYPSELCGRI